VAYDQAGQLKRGQRRVTVAANKTVFSVNIVVGLPRISSSSSGVMPAMTPPMPAMRPVISSIRSPYSVLAVLGNIRFHSHLHQQQVLACQCVELLNSEGLDIIQVRG